MWREVVVVLSEVLVQHLSERLEQQSCDGQDTCKEWAIIKYAEESWIPNSKAAGEWKL
jgi:hypothetical protein